MQHGPLSARGELQSHPLAGQAQACGRPHRWKGLGPDGTCRGHWLIPLHNISRFVHDLAPDHASLLCIIPSEKLLGLCSSSLRRRRSKNWHELRPIYRRNSNPSIVHDFHTSLPYRHTSPRSNNPVIHSLDSAKKKKHLRVHAAQKKKDDMYSLSLYMPTASTSSCRSHSYCSCRRNPSSLPRFLDGIRNRRTECHTATRVIPTDDPHTLPLFEEFLQ